MLLLEWTMPTTKAMTMLVYTLGTEQIGVNRQNISFINISSIVYILLNYSHLILILYYFNTDIHLNECFLVRHIYFYNWFLFSIRRGFESFCHRLRCIKQQKQSSNAKIEPQSPAIFFLHYKRVWCHCSKLTSMVVSRSWFGMLVQSALSMHWISLIVMWIVCICGYYMWFHCSCIQTCFYSAWYCWPFLDGLAMQVSSVSCCLL